MADVRTMLRQSREARRITHPHASYTADSNLRCNQCDTLVKEAAWQSHLHSSQHTVRQKRAQEAAATRASSGAGKKRKADSQSSPPAEERKKAKSVTFAAGVEEVEDSAGPEEVVEETPIPKSQSSIDRDDEVDAAEMLAFERELAEMEASMKSNAADRATISAPAMTAEEVAAQAREEQSEQRGKRDVELEAEREDAAKMLEDEFDEMEGLEERVKKLRERREELRQATLQNGKAASIQPEADETRKEGDPAPNGDEEDDDDEEDIDEWTFGAR